MKHLLLCFALIFLAAQASEQSALLEKENSAQQEPSKSHNFIDVVLSSAQGLMNYKYGFWIAISVILFMILLGCTAYIRRSNKFKANYWELTESEEIEFQAVGQHYFQGVETYQREFTKEAYPIPVIEKFSHYSFPNNEMSNIGFE